jgi:uncharacterized Ntn-hydrolase superfamily protein
MLRPIVLLSLPLLTGVQAQETPPTVATFSIVAADPATGELGVAVQSRFLAVGAVVPWAKAGVGAIATQAWANTTYGPRGLDLLAQGQSPQEVIGTLCKADRESEQRQIGIVNAKGEAANFTGSECMAFAGGKHGKSYSVQGNILAGKEVVDAMAKSFEESASSGKELAQRLIDALQAGQDAGGDRRGMQSAALLVVRKGAGYGAFNDRYRDLRVDDHEQPVPELQRLYNLHKRLFPPPSTTPPE